MAKTREDDDHSRLKKERISRRDFHEEISQAISWRLNYNDACNAFKRGEIDRVEFTERMWALGFRRHDIAREIDYHKSEPPVLIQGFVSGLAPDNRY